jgi:hypothetical protein
VADFLDAKVREIEERLQELHPLVEEFRRLEAAAAVLESVDGDTPPAAVTRARAANGSNSASAASAPVTSGRGRPRGSRGANTRATQAIELVRARPGLTIPELADHMGIKPNYLYRILPQLQEDGKVKRKDKGWHPA